MHRKSELNRIKSSGDLYISCITDEYTKDKNTYLEGAAYYSNKLACEQEVRIYLFDSDGKCLSSPDGNNARSLKASTMKELEKNVFIR